MKDNSIVVVEKKDLTCNPYQRHGGKTCPTETEACMKEILNVEVLHAR